MAEWNELPNLFGSCLLLAVWASRYHIGGLVVWWLHCDACEEARKEGRKWRNGFVAGAAGTWKLEDGVILATIKLSFSATAAFRWDVGKSGVSRSAFSTRNLPSYFSYSFYGLHCGILLQVEIVLGIWCSAFHVCRSVRALNSVVSDWSESYKSKR